MAVQSNTINQACITEYNLNNAFVQLEFGHPTVSSIISDQLVEFTIFFKKDPLKKTAFCDELTSKGLVYQEKDNAIVLKASNNQIPKLLRVLDKMAESMRTPSTALGLMHNPSTMFAKPGSSNVSKASQLTHRRAF